MMDENVRILIVLPAMAQTLHNFTFAIMAFTYFWPYPAFFGWLYLYSLR
jgi:hypothetical protein